MIIPENKAGLIDEKVPQWGEESVRDYTLWQAADINDKETSRTTEGLTLRKRIRGRPGRSMSGKECLDDLIEIGRTRFTWNLLELLYALLIAVKPSKIAILGASAARPDEVPSGDIEKLEQQDFEVIRRKAPRISRRLGTGGSPRQSIMDSNAERADFEHPCSSRSYDSHQLYSDFSEWDTITVEAALSVRLLLLGAIAIYHLRQKRPYWRGLVRSSGWQDQCQCEVDRVRCPQPKGKQTGTSLSHPTNCSCAPPSSRLTVNPAVVNNAVWLCTLLEQLGRPAATEVGFPVTEVCRPPEREHYLDR